MVGVADTGMADVVSWIGSLEWDQDREDRGEGGASSRLSMHAAVLRSKWRGSKRHGPRREVVQAGMQNQATQGNCSFHSWSGMQCSLQRETALAASRKLDAVRSPRMLSTESFDCSNECNAVRNQV